ncbi:MAG: lipoprotein-releasing system ATP-binding protein [Limisphaerales bacterium]
MNTIKAKGLQKAYQNLQVLKGVDLDVESGEIVAIVGASGAGKSTLLHILGTLDRPDEGLVQIGGEQISGMSKNRLDDFRNQKIGFVFQSHHLLPEFTALENVAIPGLIAKKDEKEVYAQAKELLVELGLKDRITHKPTQLSGGEQQRVAVARAFINQPAVILADEPSGNLDSDNSRELHELFFRLRDRFGQTFVIVTHNQELADMSDRKLVMVDGKIEY